MICCARKAKGTGTQEPIQGRVATSVENEALRKVVRGWALETGSPPRGWYFPLSRAHESLNLMFTHKG
jgi:hypothetical protein